MMNGSREGDGYYIGGPTGAAYSPIFGGGIYGDFDGSVWRQSAEATSDSEMVEITLPLAEPDESQ